MWNRLAGHSARITSNVVWDESFEEKGRPTQAHAIIAIGFEARPSRKGPRLKFRGLKRVMAMGIP